MNNLSPYLSHGRFDCDPKYWENDMDEDIEDVDGKAIQAAYDLIKVILDTDPNVYDEIAAPVMELLKQRLQSSWRD